MSTFLRTLQFMKPFRIHMLAAIALGFMTVGANIGLMGTSGYLIAAAALQPETVLLLWLPIVGVRFFGLSRGVFRYLERLVSHDLTFRILARIRVWLYQRLEPKGAELLETERSGKLLANIVSDVEQLQHFYLRVIAPPVIALLTGGLGFGILAMYDMSFGLIFAGMMLVAGVGIPAYTYIFGRDSGKELVDVRSNMYTEASNLVTGLSDFILNGREVEQLERIKQLQLLMDSKQRHLNQLSSNSVAAMTGIAKVAMWLVLLMAVPLVYQGGIKGIAIPTLLLVTLAGFEALSLLPAAFQQLGQSLAAGKRLYELADVADDIVIKGSLEHYEKLEIQFDRVTMQYPDGTFGLRQMSFRLKSGQHVAIVGESGAGKSTILQLLLKLRDYPIGSITINGMELKKLPEEEVRNLFAVVTQQVQLFNASVLENLRLAKPDASLEECKQAAILAQLHDTIEALPNGYETVIGEWGARLSGGERQRLALARALLRDAPIVLFDEPTTGLDMLTEQAIVQSMRNTLQRKSVLWITHKLEGLEQMDEILVVRDGSICEQGSQMELLARQGMYYRLHEAQMRQRRFA